MRKTILIISLCFAVVCSICLAEEADYYDWKGLKSYSAHNFTESIAYFDQSIKMDPAYTDAWVHKGDAERALRDYNASIESYMGALQANNQTKAAWSGLVESYISLKNYAQAAQASAKIAEIEPNRKDNWLKAGNLLQMQGDYENATDMYDHALLLDPNYKDALYRKALSLIALDENGKALDLLDLVLMKDPKYKLASNAKGLILEAEGKYESASEAYENASQTDPLWGQPRINDIHALQAMGRTDEAIKIFVTL